MSSGIISPEYLYMHDEKTVDVAKRMLNKISYLLGMKLSLMFADECIADAFESITERLHNKGLPMSDINHFMWIQKKFGLINVAVEVSHSTR